MSNKRWDKPGSAKNRSTPKPKPKPASPLNANPPAQPLEAVRGSFYSNGRDVESWFGYDVKRDTRFEAVVDPATIHLHVWRGQDTLDVALVKHDTFATHAAARDWVTRVFGVQTLSELDGEIDRLAKRAATGLPYGADNWREGSIDFEGVTYPCLQQTSTQTRHSLFVTADEVIIDVWWYHPQYDEEPNTRVSRFAVAAFLSGEGQREALEMFGTRALDRTFALCRDRAPGRVVKDIRSRGGGVLGAFLKRIGLG